MDVKYDVILGHLREGDSGGGGGGGVDSATVKQLISSALVNSVGSGTVQILQGGVSKGEFSVNQSGGTSIDLDAGGGGGTPVIVSGATVTSITEGGNVQLDIEGGVLSISATDTQPTPVMASGSEITSIAAGTNVTLGVDGGVMTISATDTGISEATASSIASTVAQGLIPTVGSGILTISQGGVSKGSFNANATGNSSIELDAPGIDSETASSIASSVATGLIPTVGSATITISQGTVSSSFNVNATADAAITLPDPGINATQAGILASNTVSSLAPGIAYESIQSNVPTIVSAMVSNAMVTITQGGTSKGAFTLNQTSSATIELDAGGGSSDPNAARNAALIFG